MPRKRAPRIRAWSYSRLNTYRSCPLKAKLQFIDKLPIKESPPLIRGQQVHKEAEDLVKGTLAGAPKGRKKGEIPESLETFDEEFRELRKLFDKQDGDALIVAPEGEWAVTKDWEPCDWFAREAWCRVKLDCFVLEVVKKGRGKATKTIARVIDYKTGKVRKEQGAEQLKLYALLALLLYPDLDEVHGELWYVDEGVIYPDLDEGDAAVVYTPDDLETLKAYWENESKAMLADAQFAPRPSRLCQWCDFSKANGGPCEY